MLNKIPLTLIFLLVVGVSCLQGQSSSIGLRLGNFQINQSQRTRLEGAPIVFSNWAASSYRNKDRNFAIGGYYEFERTSNFYKRFILQYEESFSNGGRTWNVANGESVVLDLHRSAPAFTGAVSMGRFWQLERLRFAFGFEAGLTYSPSVIQSERYTFYDSLGAREGIYAFKTTNPEVYQPYLKWFGSAYYRFSKRFSVGIELAYGFEGYYSKGTRSVKFNLLDPSGNILSTSTQNNSIRQKYINLPETLTLPFFGLSYNLGSKEE